MEEHKCNQEATLATICEKISNIETDIKEIKEGQTVFLLGMNAHQIASAKYPSPEFVNKSIAKIDRHDLYFKIIWVALGFAWVILVFLVDKFWK